MSYNLVGSLSTFILHLCS